MENQKRKGKEMKGKTFMAAMLAVCLFGLAIPTLAQQKPPMYKIEAVATRYEIPPQLFSVVQERAVAIAQNGARPDIGTPRPRTLPAPVYLDFLVGSPLVMNFGGVCGHNLLVHGI